MKGIIIRLEEDRHKQLKVFCAEKGISMQEFFTKAAEEYKRKWVV